MKKALLFVAFIVSVLISVGQDTIVVQTLTFDSITTRRGFWEFPDSTHNFRKILMNYTLKCDAATTQDGYACGEWDYLTYNNIYDHTGELDSNYAEHHQYLTGTTSPEIINTTNDQPFSLYQEEQFITTIDSVISETQTVIGSGLIQMDFGETKDGRVQFYWPDSILTQAGFSAGDITGLKLDIQSIGTEYFSLKIKIKQTNLFVEENFDSENLTEVYNRNTILSNIGWNNFNFHTPFTWDGISGLLIEFSYDNNNSGVNSIVLGELTTNNSGVFSAGSDDYLKINDDRFVSVPVNNLSGLISDEITISFWQYGDPNIQPQNDYIFEAYDINNKRVLSTHLPWSNGNVYWDAGNTGSTYDRIYKAANFEDYAGQWNHWAMTKNTNTGYMRIYLNGDLWHFANGKTRSMAGIEKFIIGANAKETSFYDGYINEFRIWNVELPDSLILQWMNKDLDATHPLWNNLVCYYNFDDLASSEVIDISGVTGDGYLMGAPDIADVPGEDFYMNPELTLYRPNITFIQGSYISTTNTVIVNDTIFHSPMSVVEFEVAVNEVLSIDTMWYFEGGWNYVYDVQGVVIDSLLFPVQLQITNSILQYYEPPFEVINRYEIGRYITPYGIGLSLGADGFTWSYDVTDYAPLLVDMVELSAGNQQELIDIKFIMIEGTPARDVKEITRIWGQRASYSYNDLDGDNKLSNTRIGLNPDAETFKVKTRLTGHGHNSTTGSYPHCCEWKDNTHYLIVNNDSVEQWHIWQTYDCAQNPVYPQGGTWPGSREGWCPGDVVKDNEFEITEYITGDSVDIDYDITDIPSNNLGMGGGNYVIAMQFLQYSSANFSNDAEIIDVISPNKSGYYSRENPICNNPKIRIRNSGSSVLTNLEFEYFVSGGTPLTYSWVGSLKFMEEEIVSLPVINEEFWGDENTNFFNINISSPNGNQDENTDNDIYTTSFITPHIYNNNFILLYKSNNLPQENYYEVTDMNDNVVFSRYQADASTVYYDTLNLQPGCYTLNLYDSGNDGLSYWAYPAQGSGYLKLKKIGGGTLKIFESEFGHNIMYAFTIGDYTNINEIDNNVNIELFPNPTVSIMNFDISGYTGDIYLQLFDITGKQVFAKEVFINDAQVEKIDVNYLKSGTYLLNAFGKDINFSRSIIINR